MERGSENPRSSPSQESGFRKELKIPRESHIRSDGSECGKRLMLLLLLLPVLVLVVVVVARWW